MVLDKKLPYPWSTRWWMRKDDWKQKWFGGGGKAIYVELNLKVSVTFS
jgi:hypothetical protein